jgi:HEAT repeat protein
MTAAFPKVLLLVWLVARPISWPGALEVDGRAVADLEEARPRWADSPADAPRVPADAHRSSADAQPAPTDAQRLTAIDRLVARYGVDGATPFLLPMLADREPTVRLYVGRLLARAGAPAATTAAIGWIKTPTVPIVDRAFGLDVLGQAATLAPAARAIVEQAVRDPEATIRAQALEALERHPIGPSLRVVLGALDDDNREVRLAAVRLAAAAGDPLAALPLLGRLEDVDRQIRLQATEALGRLADLRAVPALLRLTGEGTADLRTAAIDALGALGALGEIGTTAAVPVLAALARRGVDDLARHAMVALGEIGTPSAIAALIAALRVTPAVEEAALGLRHAGPAAVAALVGEVERGAAGSAARAAALLGEIGDRRATGPICRAFERDGEGGPLGLAALAALARLADPDSVPTLTRAAESPDPEIRLGAFAASLAIADPRSVAVVEGGLLDPDARVRALAARLAASVGARAAAPALAARIADPDAAVRRAAARGLAQIGNGVGNRVGDGVGPGDASRGLITPVLAALAQPDAPSRDDDELEAIGDALEALAGPADVASLGRAFATARGDNRAPIARGLAAASAGRSISDRTIIDQLLAAVADGGLAALAAADTLAAARVPSGAVAALARAFADAERAVRARLCPAIASTPDGGAWLATLILSSDQAPEVRAAAAWAARGGTEARAALESATHDVDAAVAANARAALSAGAARTGTGWTAVRLRATDDLPLVGRWVTMANGQGPAVEAMTDSFGVARVSGLPPTPTPAGHQEARVAGLRLRDGS